MAHRGVERGRWNRNSGTIHLHASLPLPCNIDHPYQQSRAISFTLTTAPGVRHDITALSIHSIASERLAQPNSSQAPRIHYQRRQHKKSDALNNETVAANTKTVAAYTKTVAANTKNVAANTKPSSLIKPSPPTLQPAPPTIKPPSPL